MTIRKFEPCPQRGYVEEPQTWASDWTVWFAVVESRTPEPRRGGLTTETQNAVKKSRPQCVSFLLDLAVTQRRHRLDAALAELASLLCQSAALSGRPQVA